MKIAIMVRKETFNSCAASGCLKAFASRSSSFEGYGEDVELVEFVYESDDLECEIEKLVKDGVEAVHLSTCIRAKSSEYEVLAEQLSKHFHVIGYTHGSEQGRTKNAINLKKKE